MSARLTVLASGSSGNATLVQAGDFGLLIDCGLGERVLSSRLRQRSLSWRAVHALILTHTHTDHWHKTAMAAVAKHKLPVYCHAAHAQCLHDCCEGFQCSRSQGRVHFYHEGQWLSLGGGMRLLPLTVSHDCEATFAFRIEGPMGLFGPAWAIGYAADLGSWTVDLAKALADVDLLALEFNHDEQMQRTSRRPEFLKKRVLGDHGHLSNRQAAAMLRATREHSAEPCLRYVVSLHRSRECNEPALVKQTLEECLCGECRPPEYVLAEQHEPTPTIEIGPRVSVKPQAKAVRRAKAATGGFFD